MNELNENEREVLRILWQADHLKPAEIQSDFTCKIENATLRSILRNLIEKQLVTRTKQGKAFLYRAKSRRGTQFSRAMQRMAEIFTGGSKADLMLELLRRENLSDT
ncbi:MAG TPA: BlaI/MecI/CopY family transcriptional regulator [Planctomycetaceae bacterium]|nr:BlaI/MecI/CopY family transcriptional regulator [Planctomycetaceae bacterium]HQZ66149.1 BlaI/MecI/CopY family transcriptional regulator [Planctomycetaceae bacterium]